MIRNLSTIAVAFFCVTSLAFSQQLNVLVIGSTHSYSEGGESGVVHEKPFNPTAIATHLQGILAQDPAITDTVNVVFEDIYKTKLQTVIYSASNPNDFTSHCYSLAQHYLWPDGKAARLANLRGQGTRVWDYIVLCNDPYIMANFPGMVAEGVKLIKDEVAKSPNPAQVILLGQWPESSSTFTANQFNEIANRVGNSASITVVPAGKAWDSYGSKDSSANHPTPRGEYLAAASIYSKLFNRSAKTSAYDFPSVGDAIADQSLSVIQSNAGVAQYSGTYTSFNPFQMKYLTKRVVSYRETGTSTEDRIGQALDRLDDVQRITFNTSGYAGVPGTRWDFNYGRGNDWWEPEKQYDVNPTIYDWVYGFPMHHYDTTSAPTTMPYGIDKHYYYATTYEDGTDLGIPYNMIRPGTREPDWPEAVRAIPIRLMWQKMCEVSPGFNPLGDSTHMNPYLNDASAAFMYTLLSGRCPIIDEPTPKASTNPAWMQWLGHKTGYETAWQMSHLTTRSPGFKVLPAVVSATSVTPTTNTTMTVQFMNQPQSDVTVNVSISNANAAIVGSKQLLFTPQNHNAPQSVVVSGLHGSAASEAFNVVFTTVSTDEVYNELSDSWAYQTTRSAPVTLTRVDKGTTQVTANQNLPVTINLNTAGAISSNTTLAGPSRGTTTWSGSNVIYTPGTDFVGKDGFSFAVNNAGTLSVGYIEITVTSDVPNGMVSYRGNGSNGGVVPIDSSTYAQNATVTVLGNTGSLTRVGHNLNGWNTAANGSGTPYNAGATFTMGASGMILYAQWISVPTYTITYNGNTSNGGNVPSNQIKTDGVNLTLATNSGALTKTGHTFAGWNTAANGTGVDYAAGGTYSGNANITLYSKWTPGNYTVTFNANGGGTPSPTSKSVTYGSTYGTLATVSFVGNTFNGWFTVATGGTQVLAATNVTITANQTLFAQWTALPSYIVTYDANGADSGSVPANQSKIQDVALTLATNSGGLARTGFTFAGWNTASNGSGTAYAAGTSYTANAGTTLFAQWAGVATYTISYNGNGNTGGSAPSNQTKTQGVGLALATNSGNLTINGFSFMGWNTAANGGGTSYAAGATYTADSAVTLYAQWAISTYAVTYDGTGSTGGSVSSQTKTYDVNLILSGIGTLVRTGHTFTGWNTAADGTGTDFAADAIYSANAALALFAKWDRLPTVFALNPGNGATGASPSGNPVITFSENIAFGTGAITLRQSNGTLIESFNVASPPSGLTLSGAMVTLNPSSDLAIGASYYVEIDATAIDDLAGNSFAGFSGNGTWSFTILPLTLADSYLTGLDISSPTNLYTSLNFPSVLDGPLTGSSTLTHTGFFGGQLSLINNVGNTFDGNIVVGSGTLRVAGNPFAAVGSQTGFTAPSMNSSDTITLNRAGTLTIDDNALTGGYVTNRFGTGASSARPAVNLAGGRLNLTGLNNASSSVQTFGDLTASSGYSIITNTRSAGNPTLNFDSLAISSGAVINFYSATLGTGSADARITFTGTPTLTNGILAGAKVWNPGAAGAGEFATYDNTNGVAVFTAYDVTSNDINTGTSSTTNYAMTVATTPATLTADRAVNSLNYRANGGTWSLGGFKLTLGSGMFLRNGTNTALTINNGTLTAGNGTDNIDLHIFTAQQNVTIDAVIADNFSSVVTLVKSHGNTLTLSGTTTNNTYTGGTYVVDGSLITGNVANRIYLGAGKAVVDNATLTLGNIGATSNASGDDYTVINGGNLNLASGAAGAYTANDTFNIAANSIITGASTTNQSLNSLTRGTNITLASGAIIAHSTVLSGPLSLTTGTIKTLGTAADVYYGLSATQNNASGAITIGSGAAFRGISTDRSARNWEQGTINIASGTTSVDFQGHAWNAAPVALTLGNGATAGNPVINFAGTGTVDINARGSLALNDSTAVYGATGAAVRFVSTAGSTLTVTPATGMGSGTGIASALVNNGGSLAIGNTTALNGAVTVEAGGRLLASQAAGLTGSGLLTFNEGSILEITNATGFSDTQATAASVAAGTIVRISNGAQPGTASATLDSFLGSKSPIYQLTGDVDVPEPASLTTTMTLNKNGSGVGGIVTNGSANSFFRNNVFGQVTIGANGGVMAGTTGTELQVNETIEGTNVVLTFGTTASIDGLPKLGVVALGSAAGSNNYTGENIINAGSVRQGYANVLGALTNPLTVNSGGSLNMNGQALTVGNLSGTGGIISGGGTLTIGQGDNGGGNYQGSIQANNTLIKTGTNTITLSGTNTYTGTTAINAGKLFINGNQSTATGNVTVAATATLGGNGTLGGTTTIAAGGRLEFNLGTAAGSHNPLDMVTGKGLTFSGASVLTITSTGGASPGIYTLITGGNNIGGVAPATLNLPSGWAATVSISGNSLLLNVTSTGGPGPVNQFVISTIASPQTVGTTITGITITAQDASNNTATSFTGTVTFGGTAGITGTSGSFVAGVLTGVNVIPTVAGSNRTLTVNDGTGRTGSATFTVRSIYANWSDSHPALTNANPALDFDGGTLPTGIEWVVGGNPTSGTDDAGLAPTIDRTTDPTGKLLFSFRRTTAAKNDANTNITTQYGVLAGWTTAVHQGTGANQITITDTPNGPGHEIVTVALPAGLAGGGKLFVRLHVAIATE